MNGHYIFFPLQKTSGAKKFTMHLHQASVEIKKASICISAPSSVDIKKAWSCISPASSVEIKEDWICISTPSNF
jgi:hypothetical protein